MFFITFAIFTQLIVTLYAAPEPADFNNFEFRERDRFDNTIIVDPRHLHHHNRVDLTPWITAITVIVITIVVLLSVLMYLYCNAQRKCEMTSLSTKINCGMQKKDNSSCLHDNL